MRKNRTGCLIGLLIATMLVVVLALGAAWILLDWSARGETVSINLPFSLGKASPTPALAVSAATPAPPTATPIVAGGAGHVHAAGRGDGDARTDHPE